MLISSRENHGETGFKDYCHISYIVAARAKKFNISPDLLMQAPYLRVKFPVSPGASVLREKRHQ